MKRSLRGLPWWSSDWESACQFRAHRFNLWSGRIPHALRQVILHTATSEPLCIEPVLHSEKPLKWEAHTKKPPIAMQEDPGSIPGLGRSPGEGNGNPLQYSCLRNAMDRGAWQATVHGVAKRWTRHRLNNNNRIMDQDDRSMGWSFEPVPIGSWLLWLTGSSSGGSFYLCSATSDGLGVTCVLHIIIKGHIMIFKF